jgi:hypothetical protein
MPAWGVRTALVALRSFMESDVKGQVGGLEMSEGERRNWAERSRGWKCTTCQKTNAEIMEEQEKAVREAGNSAKEEEKVPEELRMAFKDELTGSGEAKGESSRVKGKGRATEEDEESAQLAEGFVQTAPTLLGGSEGTPIRRPAPISTPLGSQPQSRPISAANRTQSSPSLGPDDSPSTIYPGARPGAARVPQPTGGPAPRERYFDYREPPDVTARRVRERDLARLAAQPPSPAWLDHLIWGIGVCLVALIFKVFFVEGRRKTGSGTDSDW